MDSMDRKTCVSCGEALPADPEYFARNHKAGDGYSSWCKPCHAQYKRERPEMNRQHSSESYARHLETAKASRRNWRVRNPEKMRLYREKWQENNPEKQRAAAQQYARTHTGTINANTRNYRARKRNACGTHSADDIQALLVEQMGRCFYCGDDISLRFHVDHKQPLSRGGRNDKTNLALACPFCNVSKGNKTDAEYLQLSHEEVWE